MRPSGIWLFVLLACIGVFPEPSLGQTVDFPHHCLPGETVFLSARMTKKPERILSLCTDKSKDPVTKMTYRYGPIGAIELERVATASQKFGYYANFQSRPITYEIYFFETGSYSYYVQAAGWMGHGISLHVFKANREILSLHSGNDDNVDFYLPFPVTPKSVFANPFPLTAKAVLEERRPKHPVLLD